MGSNVISEQEQQELNQYLKYIAEKIDDEQITFDLYDKLAEASERDNMNYGYKQIEVSAFNLEYAIREVHGDIESFPFVYTSDRPDNERENYCPDFKNMLTGHYLDAKLHCSADNKAILNDEHAIRKIVEEDGYIDILVAEATYTPDDSTYRQYRELRNGGKSRYQIKNENNETNHRMIKAATTINQFAVYRVDKDMLANQLALSIMKQGKNSNGKPRNTKFVLDLSAAKPIAAIKAETNESGIREWHECDGVFDSSLCGERSPSEKLQACREQIQTAMSISPDKIRPVRNTRRKAHRYKNEGGTITVGVDSYTKTDGTHVTGYWRTVSSVL